MSVGGHDPADQLMQLLRSVGFSRVTITTSLRGAKRRGNLLVLGWFSYTVSGDCHALTGSQ